jgi:hypothetical protein
MEKAWTPFAIIVYYSHSPSKSGMLQIAHRELSPLVRERLIEMGTPQRSWIHRISANLSKPFTSFGTTHR